MPSLSICINVFADIEKMVQSPSVMQLTIKDVQVGKRRGIKHLGWFIIFVLPNDSLATGNHPDS